MDEESEHSKTSGGLWLWLVAGLVSYVLSLGPAIAVFGDTPSPPIAATLKFLYAPVLMLGETPLQRPLSAYIEFWEHLRNK